MGQPFPREGGRRASKSRLAPVAKRGEILFVVRLAPPRFSGAGRQAQLLARALRRRGLLVTMFSTKPEGLWPDSGDADGVPYLRFPAPPWTARIEKALFLGGLAIHLLRHPLRYGVVHLHGTFYVLRILRLLKPLLRFRIVYKPTMSGKDDADAVAVRLGDAGLRAVDRWVAISSTIARSARDAGIPNDQLRRIPSAVDLPRFHHSAIARRTLRAQLGESEASEIWLTVGAVIPRKGGDLLVDAWTRVKPPPVLLIVGPTSAADGGDPEFAQRLENRIRSAGLTGVVRLLGKRDDVPSLMAVADGFVLASQQEGMPSAALEALAAGLSVVITGQHGTADLRSLAESRVHVVERTPDAIAAVVRRGPREREVPASIRSFDVDSVAEQYERMYGELGVTPARDA